MSRTLDLNQLTQGIPDDCHQELAERIPPDIGDFRIIQRHAGRGLSFTDWRMFYQRDTWVERKSGKETDALQLIFFLDSPLSWQIQDMNLDIEMAAGEACVYRNRGYASSARYKGGRELAFQSVEMPSGAFLELAEAYFGERDAARLEELCLNRFTKLAMTPEMYRILRRIQAADQYRKGAGTLYLEGNLLEILSVFFGEVLKGDGKEGRTGSRLSRTQLASILAAKERIDRNPSEEFTTEVLAREAGMGLARFSRGFAQVTGLAPHAYVIHKRLEYAAAILASGEGNVSQAAMLSGYTNMSHFSAAFKKKYGLLPKEFMRG